MGDVWWKAHPHDLHRVADRVSSLYVERSHLDRDENAVVIINRRDTVRVPAAMIAVLLLGPGTRVTHGAMELLANSGTCVCWVGEQGVRMYAAGLLHRQAWLVTRPKERLAVARAMYGMRFPGEDVSGMTMQQLRGREGARVRKVYQAHSQRTGVAWNKRIYRPGEPFAAGDDLNRMISAANAALYGICHAVVVGLGASPGLGFVHTGTAISFVLDIADLYKAEYTIPLAFDLTAKGLVTERDARLGLRDRIAADKLLNRIVSDVRGLLSPDSIEIPEHDVNLLWDEKTGAVEGGTNWDDGSDAVLVEPAFGEQDLAVIGPEFDQPEAAG